MEDVPQGTKLSEKNIKKYFELRQVDASLNNEYVVTELNDLKDQYVSEEIYKNTIAYKDKFSDIDVINEEIQEAVTVSFGVNSLADSLVGTLRMGDVVKLYVVDSYTNEISELINYTVIIEEAFDASGVLIQPGDDTSLSTHYTISIDKEDEESFYKKLSSGSVKIVKVE